VTNSASLGGAEAQGAQETLVAMGSAAAEHVPTLAELGLGKGIFVGTVQKLMVGVHNLVPILPWWATIAVTVITVRTLLLPIVVRAIRASTYMAIASPGLKKIMDVSHAPTAFED
jgi:membrane protein insertase Oxa1/YidC/SpoIIIJ